MELSRKEDRRAYSWAKKALADLVQLTDPDEIEKIKNLLKQYAEIMIALPDSYLKQQEIRSVLSSKMRVRPERFDSTTFRELCILSDIADDHYDWALSRLADLCQAQVRAGDIKDALRNIKRGEALLAKIKNAGGSSEFEFRLAEVSVYSMDGKPDLLRSKLQVAMDKFLRSDWSMAYTQLVDSGFKTGQWEMTLGFIVKCLALAKTDSEKYYDLEPAIIQLSNPGAPFYLNSWCISRLRKLSATTFGNTKDYAALLTHYGLVRLTQRAERQENQFLLSEIERLFRMNLPIASIGELNNLGFYTAYRLGDKNKANVFDKDIHTWSLSHPEQSRQSFAYYFHRASFLEMHKDRDGAVAARIDSIKYVQDPLDRILALALLLNLLVESKDHRMDIYDLKLSDELSKQKPSKFFPLSYRIRSLVAAAKKDSARREDLLLKAEEAAAKFGVSDEQALSLWLLAEFYSKSQRDNEYLSTLRKGCLVTPVSIYEPYISFRLALASSLFLKGDFRGMEKVVNEASAATRPSDYYYQALVHCYRAQLKRGTGHSIDAEKYAQEAVKLTENRLNNKRDLGLYLMALSVLGKAQYQSGKKIESEKSCRRIVELSGAAPDAIESIYEARMILCDLLKERGLTANAEKELAQIKYDASKIKQPDLKAQVEKFIREHRPPGKDGSV